MSDPTSASITIFHNPACGTSRNTLALIRNSGVEPHVVEYLKEPPCRAKLVELIAALGVPVRDVLRRKGTPYDELKLDDAKWSDDDLIDFVVAHPILIDEPANRRHAARHSAVPSVGGHAGHPAVASAQGFHQGRRRAGHRRGGPPCRSLT